MYKIFEDLCKANNVTPADVARAAGIAKATLSALKKGTYTPKAEKMKKIAHYFDVPTILNYFKNPLK